MKRARRALCAVATALVCLSPAVLARPTTPLRVRHVDRDEPGRRPQQVSGRALDPAVRRGDPAARPRRTTSGTRVVAPGAASDPAPARSHGPAPTAPGRTPAQRKGAPAARVPAAPGATAGKRVTAASVKKADDAPGAKAKAGGDASRSAAEDVRPAASGATATRASATRRSDGAAERREGARHDGVVAPTATHDGDLHPVLRFEEDDEETAAPPAAALAPEKVHGRDERVGRKDSRKSVEKKRKQRARRALPPNASWKQWRREPWRRGYVSVVGHGKRWSGYLVDAYGDVLPAAQRGLSTALASWRTGKSVTIDGRLLQLVADVSDEFGGRPIRIVSGYREQSYAPDSKHKTGEAFDFSIPGVPNDALRDFLRSLPDAGVGYYPNSTHVHLDVREKQTYWVDYSHPGQHPLYAWDRRVAGLSAKDRAVVAALDALVGARRDPHDDAPDETVLPDVTAPRLAGRHAAASPAASPDGRPTAGAGERSPTSAPTAAAEPVALPPAGLPGAAPVEAAFPVAVEGDAGAPGRSRTALDAPRATGASDGDAGAR